MSIIKLNNNGVKNATAFGSISSLGSMVFIKKLTASSSATLSFVDGSSDVVLDNTYKEYLFTFNNIHPSANSKSFQFNMSTDGGSNYNVTKTSTFFYASNGESGSNIGNEVVYWGSGDLAQSTSFQDISKNQNKLIDPFGRDVNYLRVSVTDRCDFRCTSCMAEDMQFLPKKDILSLEEIEDICRTFMNL